MILGPYLLYTAAYGRPPLPKPDIVRFLGVSNQAVRDTIALDLVRLNYKPDLRGVLIMVKLGVSEVIIRADRSKPAGRF